VSGALAWAPATPARQRLRDWLDEQSGRLFIAPAVAVMLAFSIFPIGVSAWLAVSRFSLAAGGYDVTFVGVANFRKLVVGSQQYHLLGTQGATPAWGWAILAACAALVAWRFARSVRWTAALLATSVCAVAAILLSPLGPFSAMAMSWIEATDWPWFVWLGGVALVGTATAACLSRVPATRVKTAGWCGRLLAATMFLVLSLLVAGTSTGQQGSLLTTVFYVVGGIAVQFALGLGLALLCAQAIRGRDFFRVSFFLPLMVTPVGVAYTFRMLADMSIGPLAPVAHALGLGALTWAQHAWSARWVVLLSDAWQWTPFVFIVLLAAIEGQSREQVEAAQLDGASSWRIFKDITWPGIAPTAAAVVLIRLIEGFKIVDLPNVLTNGGPGIATESLTLHAFIDWRTLNLGGSAAVAYMLLFIVTVSAVSFFNFVVRPARGARA
jgi:ABC-type sugar transport system permease subunit